jgi:hypothetical protein
LDHFGDKFLYEGLKSLNSDFIELKVISIALQEFEFVFDVAFYDIIDQNVVSKAEL